MIKKSSIKKRLLDAITAMMMNEEHKEKLCDALKKKKEPMTRGSLVGLYTLLDLEQALQKKSVIENNEVTRSWQPALQLYNELELSQVTLTKQELRNVTHAAWDLVKLNQAVIQPKLSKMPRSSKN